MWLNISGRAGINFSVRVSVILKVRFRVIEPGLN